MRTRLAGHSPDVHRWASCQAALGVVNCHAAPGIGTGASAAASPVARSPRVLVARAAIAAAAIRKALQATSAAWNPPVRACAGLRGRR